MRRIFRSLMGLAVTGITLAVVRRLSRSRGLQRGIDQLQERFRGLDNIRDMPKR